MHIFLKIPMYVFLPVVHKSPTSMKRIDFNQE